LNPGLRDAHGHAPIEQAAEQPASRASLSRLGALKFRAGLVITPLRVIQAGSRGKIVFWLLIILLFLSRYVHDLDAG
jgi:hypothetical protein